MKKDYSLRRYVIGGVTIGIVIVFLFRLWDLQFMSDEYKVHADSNAFLNKIQYPSRGAMYDRKGKLLVFNQPSYDITVILREIENLDTLDLCRTLNIAPSYFLKRIEDIKDKRLNPGYSQYTHQTFMTQLSVEESGVFQEKLFKFPGFYIQRRTIRQYVYNSAAHALGDIGEVSMNDMNEDSYYARGDYIGKQGIEKSYEKYLRGEKGVEVLLRDAHGRIQGHYKNGKFDKKPISGKNLTLGLDIELQTLAEKLMSNKLGSIVAIEPKTGEILCMVSAPNYAPSVMVGRQRGKNHVGLEQDPLKPLFNRAIMGTYPPGSTFKPAQGMIFLQEEIVNTSTTFPCYQGFSFGGMNVGCHSHGSPIPFIHAISTSCNSYFCWGFFRMMENKKYGTTTNALTVWKDHMVSMGFGYRLGIDLPGEQRGLIPNAAYYDKIYRPGRWNGLRTIHTAIGQGEILLTPVQIANLAATIANRGYYITPHIVREIEDNELESRYTTPHYTTIDRQNYEYIVEGMRGAVIGSPYGATCYRANIPGIDVCGKTGTAQNRGKDHSVFMGFAPMNNPQIAISVYVENAGYGATWAVPIAALLMEKYINGFVASERAYQIDNISNTNLIPHGIQKH
ncbi:MAG: Penicillin-binding protein 2 [Candidatus Ordinivivax streblomastigis]|uniref:Penicillin-binding protein 2 n=1 Tax=Candidatus Ordinivivax streblomastigis TaxID=2540710 RepID=A0A5M8NW80_9BACT|nr:MAG: Penicillin-binding protein 2 [Candidatus Ordinivivax streblomastigis]